MKTTQERITLKAGRAPYVSVAPDGKTLAVSVGGTVTVLRAATDQEALAPKRNSTPMTETAPWEAETLLKGPVPAKLSQKPE
ncbi:MAG: hypothetical protein HYS12_21375 [Planctomycetes bacterium]|nr:hypothetical protein [Planctomycetota bacterium]